MKRRSFIARALALLAAPAAIAEASKPDPMDAYGDVVINPSGGKMLSIHTPEQIDYFELLVAQLQDALPGWKITTSTDLKHFAIIVSAVMDDWWLNDMIDVGFRESGKGLHLYLKTFCMGADRLISKPGFYEHRLAARTALKINPPIDLGPGGLNRIVR